MRLIIVFLIYGTFYSAQNLTFNPNPFNGRGLVSFTLVTADTVTLEAFSVMGGLVATIHSNNPLAAGVYNDSLIISNQPDGVYFLIFKTKSGYNKNTKLIKTFDTGVAQLFKNEGFFFYPNPANDALTIRNSEKNELPFRIINSLGQVLIEDVVTETKTSVDISGLPSGFYFLQVMSDGPTSVYRFLKQDH